MKQKHYMTTEYLAKNFNNQFELVNEALIRVRQLILSDKDSLDEADNPAVETIRELAFYRKEEQAAPSA
ncbi:MAG: hypothetical protein KDK65_04975 [Chlamydiia bacterium]|nr:hypothetical protein [Chlamydiia bacterium]